jgi:hypothetical protein
MRYPTARDLTFVGILSPGIRIFAGSYPSGSCLCRDPPSWDPRKDFFCGIPPLGILPWLGSHLPGSVYLRDPTPRDLTFVGIPPPGNRERNLFAGSCLSVSSLRLDPISRYPVSAYMANFLAYIFSNYCIYFDTHHSILHLYPHHLPALANYHHHHHAESF